MNCHFLTLFHSEFDTFGKHENIETKVSFHTWTNSCNWGYFHQEPLLDSLQSTIFRFCIQTFHNKLPSIEFSMIDIPIHTLSYFLNMFIVTPLNIEDPNFHWKISPARIENYHFFIYAFLFDLQLQLTLENILILYTMICGNVRQHVLKRELFFLTVFWHFCLVLREVIALHWEVLMLDWLWRRNRYFLYSFVTLNHDCDNKMKLKLTQDTYVRSYPSKDSEQSYISDEIGWFSA